MHNFFNISSDGLSISINVLKSTFNEYDEQYIVTMDNNFVKGAKWNEPLKGIQEGVWVFKTDMPKNQKPNQDKTLMGLVRLTQEASKNFSAFKNNQSAYIAYIDRLLDDIAKKVPINRSRLNSINKPPKLFQDQIIIPISIDAATHENERNASELASDLAYMIMFKNITSISSGVTNDLDQDYNLRILVITIGKGIKVPDIGEQFKEWIKDYRNLVFTFIILIITDFEYLKILKDIIPKYKCIKISEISEQLEKTNNFEYIFQVAIICGAFLDITLRNIPQVIIQIIYYNSNFVLVYNWIPLLLLTTSILKIFMIICCYVCKRIILCLIKRKCNFYGKCINCKRPNISPTWCKICGPLKETKGWTSGNQKLDKYIKGLQIKVMEYEKMIEWIPFERLTNFQMIRKEELGMLYMATWLDGIRIIKGDLVEYTQSRIESYGVNLIILHDFQTLESFIKTLENYMQLEGNIVYGITQNTEANQYIIVIPDEFKSKRNESNGTCENCGHYNTSPAWCQSCDHWLETKEWTSGNEAINNFIKEYQFKATEYENVIEWIQFDRLINLQEIKGESNIVFIATWVKGVRTIKGESGNFTQSRTISSVDLMKLEYSQTNISDILEKFKNHIQSKKYRIHGITQDTETGQYMLVTDFYNNKRMPVNGICEHCKRYNTSPVWCQLCDPPKVDQVTSGDKKIDDCIKEFQLKATTFETVIEWIPFNRLKNTKIIGKGGFGTVYSSIWLDGKRMVEGGDNLGYVRCRKKSSEVALKTLAGSQTSSSEFLNEFKHHMQCRLEGSALEVYGLTQNTEDDQYMMVYQYANRGNLHDFLTENFRALEWQEKLKYLAEISYDLSRIHKAGLIHGDFHSSNILLNQVINGSINSYISDLGLSRKQDEHDSKCVYGVMPYIAPEVLKGLKHTQEADIYSLGVIMAEISTGIRPHEGHEFNTELALAILNGLRPEFAKGTPNCYIELAKRCMDSDPLKRPNAKAIYSKINQWKKILEAENLTDKKELDIKKKFIDANSIIKKKSIISLSTSQDKYVSTFFELPADTSVLLLSIHNFTLSR
ncbi:hypothetical protein C2G38_2033335 [Gigaspora rosea]|uniref:Protein kinase domain-containing protein n=1 Tax=Gigaspora rosea TaxID=44941 RepID=A0A397VLP7_9GLOM|nr:hypothetical protein C2G38_2033335 [Gigaspora rosea]